MTSAESGSRQRQIAEEELGECGGVSYQQSGCSDAVAGDATVLVVSTVACPVSDHHSQVGAWWVVQLGCGLGLVTTSTLGLRRG